MGEVSKHIGAVLAFVAVMIGAAIFHAGLPAAAIVFVSIAAITIGDAWDEETRLLPRPPRTDAEERG